MPPKRQEVTSQATPLAKDLLEVLRGQLSGAFGTGVGPLQREAGTAVRQYLSSGAGQFDLSPLFEAFQTAQQRQTEQQVGDLREAFGIMGNRFGTPLATGEARLREGIATNFAAQLGEIARQTFESQQSRLLQSMGLLQQMGQQNIEPFIQLAMLGIQPDVFTENPFVTGVKALTGGAKGIAEVKGAFG